MFSKLVFHRFKKFDDLELELKPSITILAGGNNSGKTSFMQGLAVWEFCKTVMEMEKGHESLCSGERRTGIGLNIDEFTPIDIPSLRHLWNNLRTQKEDEKDGYTLWIELDWKHNNDNRFLKLGLSLVNDRLFIKTLDSNVSKNEKIPRIAYFPPFAGMVSQEPRYTYAMRRKLLGQGLSGAIIRNILLDMYRNNNEERIRLKGDRTKIKDQDLLSLRKNDPWERLSSVMEKIFNYGIKVESFNELYHTYIRVLCYEGEVIGKRFKRKKGYSNRDIMVEGSGFLQWITVIALVLDPDINLVLLDEPDAHLHPTLQKLLLAELKKIAIDFNKQVFFATHSPSLLSMAEPNNIMQFRDYGKEEIKYLVDESQKTVLLEGLGSKYSPKINQLMEYKKALFVENESDYKIINEFADRLNITLPSNFVVWDSMKSNREIKNFFTGLSKEVPSIKGIRLRDRDDEHINTTDNNLNDKNWPDNKPEGLLFRKWRRREIENYLLHPDAISRACNRTSDEIITFINDSHDINISHRYVSQDETDAILNAKGKEIIDDGLYSIKQRFGVNKYDIVKSMNPNEIPEDIKIFINLVVEYFS